MIIIDDGEPEPRPLKVYPLTRKEKIIILKEKFIFYFIELNIFTGKNWAKEQRKNLSNVSVWDKNT